MKGYFALHGPRRRLSPLAVIGRLVFDSYRQPQPAGIRSAEVGARQMVFQAKSFFVDLRVEGAQDAAHVSMTGQILDQSRRRLPLENVPVSLCDDWKEVLSTTTNQFGEFHLDGVSRVEGSAHLSIGPDAKSSIIIPLRIWDEDRERPEKRDQDGKRS